MDIKGAVALIAGGGGGFGAATARQLHAAGARVVVSDLDEAKGKAVADELGDGALFVRTDVTDEESVLQAIDAAAQLGPLRIAVVAHGGGGGPRTLREAGVREVDLDQCAREASGSPSCAHTTRVPKEEASMRSWRRPRFSSRNNRGWYMRGR